MDDFYDYDYGFLPEGLKRLLRRDVRKTCGRCRRPGSLRCARCRCQHYCGSDCQRAHFERHKRNCKAIGKARRKIEAQLDVEAVGATQLSAKLKLTVLKVNLADLLVRVAHEECDTILRGRMFYREALKLYAHPSTDIYLSARRCQKIFTFVEDRVMMMIMACGGDVKELEPVFMNCGGHDVDAEGFRRTVATSGRETGGDIDLVKCDRHTAYYVTKALLAQSNQNCFQWYFFWLLAYFARLSKHREDLGRLDVFQSALNKIIRNDNIRGLPGNDIAEHVSKYLIGEDDGYYSTVLPNNIREAINGIRMSDHGDDLVHLKHAEHFSREHAIGLFSGLGNALEWFPDGELNLTPMDMNMILSEISFGGGAPPELWTIYKRCIIDNYGGEELLREFIEG